MHGNLSNIMCIIVRTKSIVLLGIRIVYSLIGIAHCACTTIVSTITIL